MKVLVKAYSVFRDSLGETLELEFEKPISIRDLLNFLKNSYRLPGNVKPVIIVSDRIVSEDHIIEGDSVIHIAPPFSGGSPLIDVKVLDRWEKINFNDLFYKITHLDPELGALAAFIGFVKGRVGNADVYELEYSDIRETTLSQLEKIAKEEAEEHKLKAVILWHYTGPLKPGDLSIVIVAAAPTRSWALAAVSDIIERVKREVAIFKLERRSDGDYWVIGEGERYPKAK
ncbi:MAG: molybdenum cofactor biosynthesis protein MoaE [Desulfurococcaceae archaeon]